MINASELRLGNYILHKAAVRILPVAIGLTHFELLARGGAKDMFAIALKAELLQKCGFVENSKYYRMPEGREFTLTLPVQGTHKVEINAYLLPNTACFARASVNEIAITGNIYNLHQLQNLYYALVGTELEIML